MIAPPDPFSFQILQAGTGSDNNKNVVTVTVHSDNGIHHGFVFTTPRLEKTSTYFLDIYSQ